MAKTRIYRNEYDRRIAKSLEEGYSRSQALGHPKKGELRKSDIEQIIKYVQRVNFTDQTELQIIEELKLPIWISKAHAEAYVMYLAYRRKYAAPNRPGDIPNRNMRINTNAAKIPTQFKKIAKENIRLTYDVWYSTYEAYLSQLADKAGDKDYSKYRRLVGWYH